MAAEADGAGRTHPAGWRSAAGHGQLSDVQEVARTLNLQVHILRASTDREIESAFEAVAAQGCGRRSIL
jgi:hypothetical protein